MLTSPRRLAAQHTGSARSLISSTPAAQSVVIKPLLVATSKRLPQRTMESIRPAPGTVSPTDTLWIPSGPCNRTVPPDTCLTLQPSIVFGLVSGVGVNRY